MITIALTMSSHVHSFIQYKDCSVYRSKHPIMMMILSFSFIHSFWPFLQRPFKSSTTQRRSRLYCIEVSHRSAQATVGKGLAQGPYVAVRVGVEPTTLQLKVIDSTNAPPCPHSSSYLLA